MRVRTLINSLAAVAVAGLATAAVAGPADDFNAAYAEAEAASKQAVAMKTQWTTTVAELAAAKKAADAGKYDEAIALAQKAEALANASIAQAKEQQADWRQGVIR
ncbi:MAG TPA: hypothetical protein VLX44_06910 [Xanthobacteraceae bacterium]|nr:hypothetical protein [Xanthobacteraceae bacterium]